MTPQKEVCWNNADDNCNATTDSSRECLVNTGVVVRYFINEAEAGQGPGALQDAAPDPLPLTIAYGSELSFTKVNGHRGLKWTSAGGAGKAFAFIDGTKIQTALSGHTGTIEVVMTIEDVLEPIYGLSRISYIGPGTGESFSLYTPSLDEFRFRFNYVDSNNGSSVGFPSAGYNNLGRMALHLVLDTSAPVATERAKLYMNGILISTTTMDEAKLPAMNETIDMPADQFYALGNTQNGGRSFQGTLYYAAMYSAALSEAEITTNASILLIDDDAL